jgi:hypothetical protein
MPHLWIHGNGKGRIGQPGADGAVFFRFGFARKNRFAVGKVPSDHIYRG